MIQGMDNYNIKRYISLISTLIIHVFTMHRGLILILIVWGAFSQDNISPEQQQLSMKRTACLVLSRYHSNANKEYVEEVMNGLSGQYQQKYINKLYVTAIQSCMPKISADEAQEFFVENSQFNPANLFYLFDGFDYSEPANDLDGELNPHQKMLLKFIKQFDEEMQVKREEKEAMEQDKAYSEEQFSIFWLTGRDIPQSAKLIYIVVLFLVIGGGLYWGFSNLSNSKKDSNRKQKLKNKKK